jgi:hypothetical protein
MEARVFLNNSFIYVFCLDIYSCRVFSRNHFTKQRSTVTAYLPWEPWVMRHKIEPFRFCVASPKAPKASRLVLSTPGSQVDFMKKLCQCKFDSKIFVKRFLNAYPGYLGRPYLLQLYLLLQYLKYLIWVTLLIIDFTNN